MLDTIERERDEKLNELKSSHDDVMYDFDKYFYQRDPCTETQMGDVYSPKERLSGKINPI